MDLRSRYPHSEELELVAAGLSVSDIVLYAALGVPSADVPAFIAAGLTAPLAYAYPSSGVPVTKWLGLHNSGVTGDTATLFAATGLPERLWMPLVASGLPTADVCRLLAGVTSEAAPAAHRIVEQGIHLSRFPEHSLQALADVPTLATSIAASTDDHLMVAVTLVEDHGSSGHDITAAFFVDSLTILDPSARPRERLWARCRGRLRHWWASIHRARRIAVTIAKVLRALLVIGLVAVLITLIAQHFEAVVQSVIGLILVGFLVAFFKD